MVVSRPNGPSPHRTHESEYLDSLVSCKVLVHNMVVYVYCPHNVVLFLPYVINSSTRASGELSRLLVQINIFVWELHVGVPPGCFSVTVQMYDRDKEPP